MAKRTLTPEHSADSDEERGEDGLDNHTISSPGHMTRVGSHVTRTPPYRMMNRNPLYCGAESSCLWELGQVSRTFRVYIIKFNNLYCDIIIVSL